VASALYRRYRPETFAELIGQTQVTGPLMSALRADKVNHAYLFSGPRGCGKTTSARILARCLNCAEGPTDTPCGKCPSCVELARGGPGSLDVVEIDAASHNGVDDARELRERAIFAPNRDRYKIFILDEAHMVTPQGFNALLKIVEEPPEHVKFIFATTEPEKVISTIRSRTHHYPFRLVPPAELLEYLQSLLETEGFSAQPGVMPMVVRAGGGSVRDSLSLLDQLIAGSDGTEIDYSRAAALLGFTHDELLNEVIDAFSEIDAAKAFSAVDRVIQSGQDARRFLEDLLERLRDLMLVNSLGDEARAILRGISPEQFDLLAIQSNRFGLNQLTHAAEAANRALNDTFGSTNPRLQLELLCARVLAPSIAPSARTAAPATQDSSAQAAATSSAPAASAAPSAKPAAKAAAKPAPEPAAREATPAVASATAAPVAPAVVPELSPVTQKPMSAANIKTDWQDLLDSLAKVSRSAWAVAFTTKVLDYDDEVLTLLFQSQKDVDAFRNAAGAAEVLRQLIFDTYGVRVKYKARVADAAITEPITKVSQPKVAAQEPEAPEARATELAQAEVEAAPELTPEPAPEPAQAEAEPEAPAAEAEAAEAPEAEEKYGEFVLREVLGATPIENKDS
jgi:DNA polymerase III subunit gamma/tau